MHSGIATDPIDPDLDFRSSQRSRAFGKARLHFVRIGLSRTSFVAWGWDSQNRYSISRSVTAGAWGKSLSRIRLTCPSIEAVPQSSGASPMATEATQVSVENTAQKLPLIPTDLHAGSGEPASNCRLQKKRSLICNHKLLTSALSQV